MKSLNTYNDTLLLRLKTAMHAASMGAEWSGRAEEEVNVADVCMYVCMY